MKKFLAVALVLALLLSLSACGGESAPTPTATTAAPTKPAPTVQVVEGKAIEQLDDVSVYIPTAGESKELEGLPAYVYSEGMPVSYKGKMEGRYGLLTHIFAETDAAAFITYLNALESDGWVQYSNNIIEGTNLFATYTKDTDSMYCYYISTKNTAYLIRTPNQNLEIREQDNQYETVCTPQLTQIKLLNKDWTGGMSYLLRLSDGRFIVIDGGYNEQKFYEAESLYDLMQEQNVLPKITVAAWIITHPHKDHLGAAADFLRHYTTADLNIERLILNFPTDEDIEATEIETLDSNDPSRMPTFLLAHEMFWPELPIHICHTGQRWYIGDATIEYLHTLEDLYPKTIASLSSNRVNGASTIFSLEIAGQKIMFLADSAVGSSIDLAAMWGPYLKSDIMQAAHHGLRGGDITMYEYIDPMVVLVPQNYNFMHKVVEFDATKWLWNNGSGNIREIIVSGFAQRTLSLPYIPPANTEYFSNATVDPWTGK